MERSAIGSLLRAEQAYAWQLCEKQTLTYGIAYYQKSPTRLHELQQFREVTIENSMDLPRAFEEAESFFAALGTKCLRWVAAQNQQTEALSTFLQERGFVPMTYTVWMLSEWVNRAHTCKYRVLPARPMQSAMLEAVMHDVAWASEPESFREERARVLKERISEPSFDLFLAMDGQRPVGRCALFQVGDIASIMDVGVVDGVDSREVESALLSHVLVLSRRLNMKNIVMRIADACADRGELAVSKGFVPSGSLIEFDRMSNG